jgi:hypothetical protein
MRWPEGEQAGSLIKFGQALAPKKRRNHPNPSRSFRDIYTATADTRDLLIPCNANRRGATVEFRTIALKTCF